MTELPDLENGTDHLLFALPGQVRASQLDGDTLLALSGRLAAVKDQQEATRTLRHALSNMQ